MVKGSSKNQNEKAEIGENVNTSSISVSEKEESKKEDVDMLKEVDLRKLSKQIS